MFSQKSSNPAFTRAKKFDLSATDQGTMTLNGTINKTLILLGIAVVSASVTWKMFFEANENLMPVFIGGVIASIVFSLITIFVPHRANITAPLYAVAEGLFLGGLSAIVEANFISNEGGLAAGSSGIVMNAIGLTFGVFFVMLLLYKNKIITVTNKLKGIVMSGLIAVALIYFVSFILSLFGFYGLNPIHGNGMIGIGFSLFVIVLAAFTLLVDFHFIEENVNRGVPKFMEWYSAFSLMLTLVWLYIEILKLLAKLQSRD